MVRVKLHEREQLPGLTFVDLSRIKNHKDLLIQPFCLDKLTKMKNMHNVFR